MGTDADWPPGLRIEAPERPLEPEVASALRRSLGLKYPEPFLGLFNIDRLRIHRE